MLAAAAEAPYLNALNPRQREAVEALDGPVLVLAGAGTGKTRVLTTRLAHLIATRRAQPWQILAVTFTNKAAREMQERVADLIGPMAEGVQLGTFHSIAARILRRHAERVGLKPNFTILDQDDQVRLLKQILEAADIDTQKWPARVLQAIIDRWKDKGLRPDQAAEGRAADKEGFADGRAPALYAAYQRRLAELNATDFGDLLLHNLTLFTQHADVLEEYHRRIRYLLVDEYQDTNLAQYLWLRLLAQARKNICCVGDDDQSIYGWRGAEVGNILKFERDFPGAKVIRLEQNYRSTPPILAAASHLIAHNKGRLGKTLWTEAGGGEPIQVRGVWDGESEARMVCDQIEALQARKHKLDEIAILVRAGFQTREFEERFLTTGLPYRVIGGPRFYERQEIRDAVAYLRLVHQADDDLAFERIVNKPKRGLGEASLQALHKIARAKRLSLSAAAQAAAEGSELKPAAKKALGEFVKSLARWRGLATSVNHVELAETILDESGYVAMWQNDKSPEAPGRLENMKELIRALAEFDNLGGFLEHISLVMENAEEAGADRVSLMTLHSAKGLEFATVFLPGWEEGVFPHQRALDESGKAGLEEERRLAYVGLTRAKERVIISFAANRRIHNQWQSSIPSRFVDELPPEQVEVASDPGLYGSGWTRGISAPAGRRGVSEVEFEPEAKIEPWRGWRDIGRTPPGAASGGRTADEARKSFQSARKRALGRPERPRDEPEGLVVSTDPSIARFKQGDRVFHEKFGYGTVRLAEGEKLTIKFDHSDEKKVVASFVKRG
ncbi:MAG TPA: UvrD-helicase domain-containing protein [Alphaproteobacteria bacterium]